MGGPSLALLQLCWSSAGNVCQDAWQPLVGAVGLREITELQNGGGWKGPLWVTKSNPPAKAGSPTAGCTGRCPGGS